MLVPLGMRNSEEVAVDARADANEHPRPVWTSTRVMLCGGLGSPRVGCEFREAWHDEEVARNESKK